MSSSQQSSGVIRFFDALFQEQNIKWLLGLGTLILLSSSTMLLTSHWDNYTPLWKYFVLIGYTALFHVAGQIGYHRLALRKTGTGLMALTVLLIPISFAAFRWFHPSNVLSLDGLISQSGLFFLLLFNSIFAFFAAKRIFHHFLLGTQPTFLASYLILAGLAAILPALPPIFATLMSFVAWAIFTVGSIKVNRHAFWLTEEYRKPRIFGFFPILLLGTQFLTLFGTSLASHISLSWMGLGLVLTALPILIAADSLARVIQVRSQLERPPFPMSVVFSMVFGIALVIGGVFLSAHHFPHIVAFVPTALLAAIVMGVVAQRTQRTGFVWLMLLFIVAVYQTSPVFFKELLMKLADQGAHAIGEEKLPFAFYGLTYLPLLSVLSLVSQWLSNKTIDLFAIPIKKFSILFAILLAPIAFGHEKALFPVSLALSGLMIGQTFLFKDRRLQLVSLGVFLTAVLGLVPSLRSYFEVYTDDNFLLMTWIVTGVLLQFPGMLIDKAVERLPKTKSKLAVAQLFQKASLAITLCCACIWTFISFIRTPEIVQGAISLTLLIWHSFRFRKTIVSVATLILPIVCVMNWTSVLGWSSDKQILIATMMVVGLSLTGRYLKKKPYWNLTLVFGKACEIVSAIGLFGLQAIFIPSMIYSIEGLIEFRWWGAAIINFLGVCELTWRSKSRGSVILSWISMLTLSAALLMEIVQSLTYLGWIPVVWSILSFSVILTLRFSSRNDVLWNHENYKIESTLEWCVGLTVTAITLLAIPFFDGGFRVAGLIAVIGAFVLINQCSHSWLRDILLLIANFQVFAFIVQICNPAASSLLDIRNLDLGASILPIAFASVFSALIWRSRRKSHEIFFRVIPFCFEVISGLCLFQSLFQFNGALSLYQYVPAAMTFLILATNQMMLGLKKSQSVTLDTTEQYPLRNAEFHIWSAEFVLFAGITYFALLEQISFNSTFALFLPILLAILTWVFTNIHSRNERWKVINNPFRKTAFALPGLTVMIALGQNMNQPAIYWPGVNSLAVLLSAGFYFWRGLEESRSGLMIGSAIILNLSLAMLWNDLNWTDPQLFLIPIGVSLLFIVEILRSQIPAKLQNPLRYAGALIILVSPTFEIVGGSWIHLITLMVTSVLVVIVAMGLRVKALMYTGSAFLLADLVAIVVRGTIDQPSLLWLTGIAVGAGVIGLAAYCERHREKMLQRLRFLSAELETWS